MSQTTYTYFFIQCRYLQRNIKSMKNIFSVKGNCPVKMQQFQFYFESGSPSRVDFISKGDEHVYDVYNYVLTLCFCSIFYTNVCI